MTCCACLCATAAGAETRKLASSGAWTLYRTDEFAIAMGSGEAVTIDDSCVAATGNDKATMAFVAPPPAFNRSGNRFAGAITLQVSSTNWNLRSHEAEMSIGDDKLKLTVDNALYDNGAIRMNLGGGGRPPEEFRNAVATWKGAVRVRDERGRTRARFPVNGLKTIYAEMLRCGGL